MEGMRGVGIQTVGKNVGYGSVVEPNGLKEMMLCKLNGIEDDSLSFDCNKRRAHHLNKFGVRYAAPLEFLV